MCVSVCVRACVCGTGIDCDTIRRRPPQAKKILTPTPTPTHRSFITPTPPHLASEGKSHLKVFPTRKFSPPNFFAGRRGGKTYGCGG